MKIRPVGAALIHEDGETDKTKLTVAFRNFANAPKIQYWLSKEEVQGSGIRREIIKGLHRWW